MTPHPAPSTETQNGQEAGKASGAVAEIERGHDFADRLYELCREYGPSDRSQSQKDALASHLVDAAIRWVLSNKARP